MNYELFNINVNDAILLICYTRMFFFYLYNNGTIELLLCFVIIINKIITTN